MLSVPLNIWLVRVLEPETFGQYAYLLSYSLLFSPLIVLGLPALLCREVARQPQKIAVFLTASYTLMAASSLVVLPILLITGGQSWLLFVAALGMIFSSSATLLQLAIVGLNRSYLSAIAQVMVSLITSFGTLILILKHPQLDWLIGLSALSGFLQHFAYIVIAKLRCPELVLLKRWPSTQEYWELLKLSTPYLFLVIFSTIYFRIDITLLKRWSTLSEVAGYSAAYKFVEIALVFVSIIGQVFLAEFSNMIFRKSQDVEQVLRRGFRLMLLLSLPLATYTCFYAKDILSLFYGNKYMQESGTLQILAWTTVFLFTRTLPSIFFQAKNQVRIPSIIFGLSSMINIILNYFLIPTLGGFGAGLATLTCEIFNLIGFSYCLKKYADLQIIDAEILPALTGFACMSGTLYTAQAFPIAIGIVLGLLSFLGGFALAGGSKSSEFRYLKALLRRQSPTNSPSE